MASRARDGWVVGEYFYARQFVLLLEVVHHLRGVDSAKGAAGHVVLEDWDHYGG